MNHHRAGSGPPLVLIHGVGHHWQGWKPVIAPLAEHFDVIACDSPGFGASAPLRHAGPATIEAYADAFEVLFHELGVVRPHVAGNSMGGGIALELGRRNAVSSVSAFAPVGFWTAAERRYCQLSVAAIGATPPPLRPILRAALRTSAGRSILLAQMIAWPGQLPAGDAVAAFDATLHAPALGPALEAFSRYRCEPPAVPWAAPTTIAWGKHDRLLPYALQAPRARTVLPFAEHVTLGAGHLPCSDDPAAVVAVIRRAAARASARA